jgi:hypothetical protein
VLGVQNKERRIKKMKSLATILLVIGCFALSPAVKAVEGAPLIVGLWHNHFVSDIGPAFETYSQWHSDGLEIDIPSFAPGACMGTWTQTAERTYKLFHVGWTPGGTPPAPSSVRFELRIQVSLSVDRNSFDGVYDQKFFDANGDLVFEDTGKIESTRLSVDHF